MKYIYSILMCLFLAVGIQAQDSSSPTIYVATGLSMTNSVDENFTTTSYPSVEVGVTNNDFAYALVLGRNNITDAPVGVDGLDNFWYEGKTSYSFPLGTVTGYGVFGVGRYFDGSSTFIEYGVGISKAFGDFGIFAQVANWDGTTYFTPGVSYCF